MNERDVSPGKKEIMARLEQWTVTGSVTVDGETRVLQLGGAVYRHRKYADGVMIITSKLVEFDPVAGFARTRNTRYELGARAAEGSK